MRRACSLLNGTGAQGFPAELYLNCAITNLCSHEVLFMSSLCTLLLPLVSSTYHGVFIQERLRTFWRAWLPVNWNPENHQALHHKKPLIIHEFILMCHVLQYEFFLFPTLPSHCLCAIKNNFVKGRRVKRDQRCALEATCTHCK